MRAIPRHSGLLAAAAAAVLMARRLCGPAAGRDHPCLTLPGARWCFLIDSGPFKAHVCWVICLDSCDLWPRLRQRFMRACMNHCEQSLQPHRAQSSTLQLSRREHLDQQVSLTLSLPPLICSNAQLHIHQCTAKSLGGTLLQQHQLTSNSQEVRSLQSHRLHLRSRV